MLKVSIFNDEVSKDLDEALALLDSWGRPVFDLRESIFGDTVIDDISDEQRDILKEKLSHYNFEIGCIGTRKLIIDPSVDTSVNEALIARLIKTAKTFSVPFIRICNVAPRPDSEAERHDLMLRSVDEMRNLAELAYAEGITLLLENKPTSITNKGTELVEFLDLVGSKGLKIVWDAANSWIGGFYGPLIDYEICKKYIGIVHLKGAVGAAEDKTIYDHSEVMGDDEFPHQEIIDRLIADGYSGPITLDLATDSIDRPDMTKAKISKISLDLTEKMILAAEEKIK